MRPVTRIAIVVSHPIQHFCPQYTSFSTDPNVELKVFFASSLGLKKYFDKNFQREISWSTLRLDTFNHYFLNGDAALPSSRALDAKTLEHSLENFNPNLLIVYGYIQKLQRRAHKWAAMNNVKLAYISDSELNQKRNHVLQYLKFYYLKRYFSKIDYFLSVGNANEAFYTRHGVPQHKILRMHFPIDLYQYEKMFNERSIQRRKIRAQYNISDTDLVLVVVGKLVPWKNQDHIIKALAMLESENMPVRLFIIGSGIMEARWKAMANQLQWSTVYFTGFVNAEDLPGFYAAADIYVHSASIEPHGLAISEAIYMGLPAIVSDRCGSYGPTDDVQEGLNGYVYPFGDISALTKKIKALMNENTRQLFGLHSRKIALEFQRRAHFGVLDALKKKVDNPT